MIDWIDDLAKDWARYIGKPSKAWPARSVMARIAEEGSVGAAIRSHVQHIPVDDMPADVMEFHRAWRSMRGKRHQVLWLHYCSRASVDEKRKTLNLSNGGYYSVLSGAHIEIWQVMDQQERMRA